ncbi:MAG: 3-oxoacyl-ACP reductase FabG [Burkholderiaceae bacterium]|nr:MAG: 3-oxoacyl-ACP reductase FabG [Burkholderiaceae bacterium]
MSDVARLQDRVAIVTGAAQGIGAEYAHALASQGAAVVVADVLGAASVVQAITKNGGKALAIHCDVTDSESVQAMVSATLKQFGKLDILVNNAALFGNISRKPFDQIESAEWDRMMAVNVRGAFECVKAVAPAMRSQHYGKIINIASGTVFKGSPMLLHYVTSKGAIVAMSRSLARELGNDGIRVNTLAPGLVMSENVLKNPDWSAATSQKTVNTRAIKRDSTPQDLRGTLIYLCSTDSDFVTGQVLVVDGGAVMH